MIGAAALMVVALAGCASRADGGDAAAVPAESAPAKSFRSAEDLRGALLEAGIRCRPEEPDEAVPVPLPADATPGTDEPPRITAAQCYFNRGELQIIVYDREASVRDEREIFKDTGGLISDNVMVTGELWAVVVVDAPEMVTEVQNVIGGEIIRPGKRRPPLPGDGG